MMKNILLIILLLFALFLGIKTIANVCASENALDFSSSLENEYVQQMDESGCILPFSNDSPLGNILYMDTQSLPRQLSNYGRIQRITSIGFGLSKFLIRKIATIHRIASIHSYDSIFTTFPFQNWTIASEHYVFGLRRILI